MANEMRTYVTVHSDSEKVATRLQEIFKYDDSGKQYEANALDVINNLEGTNFTYSNETTKEDWNKEVDFPSNELWDSIIGPKRFYVEYDHGDLPENCNVVLRTAWSVPTSFLERLRDELLKIDENCYITGTYEDESYDPSGAFVYGKFEYDYIEDYNEEYDKDESYEDDFYNEKWTASLAELEIDLEKAYIEYLKDREENPQDYE